MRLINTLTFDFEEFLGRNIPRYAILSHTWGEEEVAFKDWDAVRSGGKAKGFDKIKLTCELARDQGLGYAWVDTCCIDKSSSAELSEAINSMFRWYSNAEVCYAFLSDLEAIRPVFLGEIPTSNHRGDVANSDDDDVDDVNSNSDDENFDDDDNPGANSDDDAPAPVYDGDEAVSQVMGDLKPSRWFTRGWPLQELIAPVEVQFYNARWELYANKTEITQALSRITRIPREILEHTKALASFTVVEKMHWASMRVTTRVEDEAYCLLGLFGIHIPLMYGEEEQAFYRLQEEIIRRTGDMTILAWRPDKGYNPAPGSPYIGFLSPSPRGFASISSLPGFSALSKGAKTTRVSIDGNVLRINSQHLEFFKLETDEGGRVFKSFGLLICPKIFMSKDDKGYIGINFYPKAAVYLPVRKIGPNTFIRDNTGKQMKPPRRQDMVLRRYEGYLKLKPNFPAMDKDLSLLPRLPDMPRRGPSITRSIFRDNRANGLRFNIPSGAMVQMALPRSNYDHRDNIFIDEVTQGSHFGAAMTWTCPQRYPGAVVLFLCFLDYDFRKGGANLFGSAAECWVSRGDDEAVKEMELIYRELHWMEGKARDNDSVKARFESKLGRPLAGELDAFSVRRQSTYQVAQVRDPGACAGVIWEVDFVLPPDTSAKGESPPPYDS